MKVQDVFPKRLTLISILFLLGVFALLLYSNSRGQRFTREFYSQEVPALQYYCGASRLLSVNQVLRSIPEHGGQGLLKVNQQGILYSIDELAKTEGLQLEGAVFKKYRESVEAGSPALTDEEFNKLRLELQDHIESYIRKRGERLERHINLSQYVVLAGLIGVALFLGILFTVYRVYQQNLRRLEEINRHLEEERAGAAHNAKLASLGEMAAGLAHEINNPLAVISSSSVLIRRRLQKGRIGPEDIEDGLNEIDATVNRISRIVKGMRNLSRDSDQEPQVPTPLSEIFDDVLAVCSERLKNNEVQLIVENRDLLETTINCARIQLSQVLLNLINNAFDAVVEHKVKWIKISLEQDGRSFLIKVADSGPGIHQEVAKRIFQPFFTTKDIGKGTGLGLSLSKSIVENHGGNLFRDEEAPHTTFIIRLPHRLSNA